MRSGNLIRRDAVMKALSRLRVSVCTRQPECTAPVGLIVILVRHSLNDGEIGLVPFEWFQAFRQWITGTRVLDIREPRFIRDPITKAEEYDTFWPGTGIVVRRNESTPQAEGFECRDRKHCSGGMEESTTGRVWHGLTFGSV